MLPRLTVNQRRSRFCSTVATGSQQCRDSFVSRQL